MTRRIKHEMNFTSYPDTTTKEPEVLSAHRLTRKDMLRYDQERGCFRGQRIRFAYAGIVPKAGDFIVRYAADDSYETPVAAGIVTLVGAKRFFAIVGDDDSLDALGTLAGDAACS